MRLYTAFIALFLLSTPIAQAIDTGISRRSLAGLNGVGVTIEAQAPELEQNGLGVSVIRTDVELKLRQAGIRVSDEIRPFCYLDIRVSVGPKGESVQAFTIEAELFQAVTLERDASITLLAPTWVSALSESLEGKTFVR